MFKFAFAFALFTAPLLLADPVPTQADSHSLVDGGIVLFTPPTGWREADSTKLPPRVKMMVVGKGPGAFPPSMNLSVEPYKGTLKQYLKIVKSMNDSQGYEWKDLGSIRTDAGNASLSQVDTKSEWGNIRLMHTILIKNGMVYILTASALKDEFSLFYKDFFASMRSLRVTKDGLDMLSSPQQKTQLRAAIQKVEAQWKAMLAEKIKQNPKSSTADLKTELFKSNTFQTTVWVPFKELLSQKFGNMGEEWHALMLQKTENDIFEDQI